MYVCSDVLICETKLVHMGALTHTHVLHLWYSQVCYLWLSLKWCRVRGQTSWEVFFFSLRNSQHFRQPCNTPQYTATPRNTTQHTTGAGCLVIVWCGTCVCVTQPMYMCVTDTHRKELHAGCSTFVWLDSRTSVTWLLHLCDGYSKENDSCRLLHICVTWRMHMCDMTHVYVWHYPRVTWPITMSDMTPLYVWEKLKEKMPHARCWTVLWHDSRTRLTIIPLTDTQGEGPFAWCTVIVWHELCVCVTWPFHMCDRYSKKDASCQMRNISVTWLMYISVALLFFDKHSRRGTFCMM